MTTPKIETAQPFKSTEPVKKKEHPKEKTSVSPRWQEVEERRSAPKSPLVKEEKPAPKKREKPMLGEKRELAYQEMKEQSPFDLFSSMNSRKVASKVIDEETASEALAPEIPLDEVDSDTLETLFAVSEDKQEKKAEKKEPLIGLSPIGQEAFYQPTQTIHNNISSAASPVASSSFQNIKLLEFADKLVKKITAMKQGGRTEITLTLKNLSLFNGGILKIVEHDSARGQYNLSFTNLNPKAHALVLSTDANRILKEALEAKGLSFHIIAASTEIEPVSSYPSGFREEEKGEEGRERDPDQETA